MAVDGGVARLNDDELGGAFFVAHRHVEKVWVGVVTGYVSDATVHAQHLLQGVSLREQVSGNRRDFGGVSAGDSLDCLITGKKLPIVPFEMTSDAQAVEKIEMEIVGRGIDKRDVGMGPDLVGAVGECANPLSKLALVVSLQFAGEVKVPVEV